MQDHTKTFWFHSIHIGNGVVTQGVKSAEALKSHFDLFGFNSEFLRGVGSSISDVIPIRLKQVAQLLR
jgi:hypothetical protein